MIFEPPKLVTGLFCEQVEDTEPLRALSWYQPFAELMLHGKQETRKRQSNITGWVLICACKNPYPYKVMNEISGARQLRRIGDLLNPDANYSNLDYGKAIAIGYQYGSRRMRPTDADEDLTFTQYNLLSWVWEYKEVHRIKPIPFTGKQGWSFVDTETRNKIQIL